MRKRVVVTGLGCVSPVGNNVKDTWNALIAGKSGAALITHFDASRHKTKFAAEVKGFDGPAMFGAREARKMDRFAQFATAAAESIPCSKRWKPCASAARTASAHS